MINIAGLDKAEVLMALYQGSHQQGLGLFIRNRLSIDEARTLTAPGQNMYFDYVYGVVLKVDLRGDSFDPWLYDRDNGEGAAANIITSLCEASSSKVVEPGKAGVCGVDARLASPIENERVK